MPRLKMVSRPLRTLKNVIISGIQRPPSPSPASGVAQPSLDLLLIPRADHARRPARHARLPAASTPPIGEEDAKQEDAGHADEEEQDEGDEQQRRQQPHR